MNTRDMKEENDLFGETSIKESMCDFFTAEKIESNDYARMMDALRDKDPEITGTGEMIEMIEAGSSTLVACSKACQFPLPSFSSKEKEENKLFVDAIRRRIATREQSIDLSEEKAVTK